VEYKASIEYDDDSYYLMAFPFGKMAVDGCLIENPDGIETFSGAKEAELAAITKKKKDEIPEKVWASTKVVSIISIVALCLSIIVSLAVRSTVAVVAAFVVALAVFIYNRTNVKKITEKETAVTNEYLTSLKNKYQDEINNFSTNHKKIYKEALNKKLRSLGLKPY
jgi:hypothetical protein